MPVSRKPPRSTRSTRAPRARLDASALPADDSPLAILQAQLTRAEAALELERKGRAKDAADAGEMLARAARSDDRARIAEKALEDALSSTETQRAAASDLEDSVTRLWRELGAARREAEAKSDQLRKLESSSKDSGHAYEERIEELEKRLRAAIPRSPTSPAIPKPNLSEVDRHAAAPANEGEIVRLRAELVEAQAEAKRMRENFEMLQTRAGKIGQGLREMRELMIQSAALFDDLEGREKAIAEIRSRSLRDARDLFLRAAGKDHEVRASGGGPPPIPKAPIEDLSEAAELLEEEVRASMRPLGAPPPEEDA